MPKASLAPQVNSSDLAGGTIQLIGYDGTAPAGQNFKRVPQNALQNAIATFKWQKITTFQNNWVKTAGQSELAVCKITSGKVFLEGAVNGGTLDSGNLQTPAFVVPEGYRPVTEPFWVFPVLGNFSVSPIPLGACIVMPNGNAHIIAPSNAIIVFPCQGDRSFF